MSVQFVCDGCGRVEPGTWRPGHEERWDEERCLVSQDDGGCGKEFKRLRFTEGEWRRPLVDVGESGGGSPWFSRENSEGQQHVCSRACIEKAASKLGVTRVVMPW